MQPPFDSDEVKRLIRLAVREDLRTGDVTTEAMVPADLQARAKVVARQAGVMAGLPLILPILGEFASSPGVERSIRDGQEISPGQTLAVMAGPARALLSAERTVLNFLQRLSGVATLTRQFVKAVTGTPVRIYDTRKTTPGWRLLEKYAVKVGGGENHRMGLHDQVLIKDNHLTLMEKRGESLTEVIGRIRAEHPDVTVEVEAGTERQLRGAVEAGADIILLDNMTPKELAAAAKVVESLVSGKRPVLEASGGVDLANVRAIAESGVDRISVGALTHSAPALDIAVEFDTEGAAP